MRRLLIFALLVSALIAATAGVAWAQLHTTTVAAAPGALQGPVAPITVPAETPHAIDQRGTLGYVPISRLEAAVAAPSPDSVAPAPSGNVTVTALVLPVVSVTVDAQGRPTRITINTSSRDPRALGFSVRRGVGADSSPVAPDAASWRVIRAALARSRSGVGIVWGA